MIKIYLFAFTVLIPFLSFAQWPECDSVIVPANAQVISTNNSQISGIRGKFWVCSDLNVTIAGDTNVVYVERNCAVSVEGDSNIIYIRKDGNITILGEYNLVIRDTTVNANMIASWGGIVPCYDLNYYYHNAPSNGCDVYSGIDFNITYDDWKISVWPNPFADQLVINNEFNLNLKKVYLLNIDGSVIFDEPLFTDKNNIMLDVSKLPPSLYLLVIHTQEGEIFHKRLIKK